MEEFVKTSQKLFVAMPKTGLLKNFQLNIFIFETRASLQSLKQNTSKSARLLNNLNQPSFTSDLVLHGLVFANLIY